MMSGLSPQCATKRTSINVVDLSAHPLALSAHHALARARPVGKPCVTRAIGQAFLGFNLNVETTQDSLTLSRNGFQESASLLASSKYPSSKSLPTHLKYSQRNDASGNW